MVGWRILLWAVLVLAALLFLYLVRGILPPFIIAFVIAALLDPSIKRLRLRGMSRLWAVSLVFVLFFSGLTAVGVVVGPRIAAQVFELNKQVVDVTSSLMEADANDNFFLRWNPVTQATRQRTPGPVDRMLSPYQGTLERLGLPTNQRGIVREYVEPYRGQIGALVRQGFGAFFGVLQNLPQQLLHILLIPILTFMILMEMEDIKRRSPRWIPPALRASALRLFEDIGGVFTRYMRGVAKATLYYTLAVTLLLVLMQVPYGALLGILFGALYLIPYLGNILAYVILFLVIGLSGAKGAYVFELANPWIWALLVTVMFFAVAFIFDHFIYPQMVGASVGLNAVVSLFVVFAGAALFGLPGMLLAYPLAGSVKVILDRLLRVTTDAVHELSLPAVPLRHRSNPVV